jgi:NAD(P)-dependent dehydrogenase (short-subunit alcohol dehydrogenase family)
MSTPAGTGPTGVGHRNAASATLTAILDRFDRSGRIPPLEEGERLDGRRCLVTGASSGLGKAIAVALARRGADVVMACRSGIPEAGEEVARAARREAVEMLPVDLADLASVNRLADALASDGRPLDRVVLNAGLMARSARRSAQGFEVMFAVHFLANRLLLDRLLEDGVVVPREPGSPEPAPRIVFVTSESHRSAEPIDFERFGEYVEYGLRDGMRQYASSKLHMVTLACALARRLDPDDAVRVAVHALCPGPVASNIAREAPAWLRPALRLVFGAFFQSPERAAEPAVFLACSRRIEHRPQVYLHMMREKSPAPAAMNPENGARLMAASDALLEPWRRS